MKAIYAGMDTLVIPRPLTLDLRGALEAACCLDPACLGENLVPSIAERVEDGIEIGKEPTRVLNELREVGIWVSMDDLGTGYSSLSYLHDLPIDTLKIDKSFVSNILRDPRDAGLSAAIIAIGRSIDLDVLAEGVEEVEQLEFLRRHGCDLAQGYLFSKPVPATAFRQLISRRNAVNANSQIWE